MSGINLEDLEKETIEKIKEESLKEYNEMSGDKNSKAKLVQTGLIIGIIIIILLTINTILRTKDVTIERTENNSATITTEVDEDGRVISTQELK